MKTKAISSFVILLLILTIQSVDSQWQQTAMTSGNISSLTATETHIFTGGDGVYSSSNGGSSWTQTGMIAHMVRADGNSLFAIGWSQMLVYRSTNQGVNWTQHQGGAADGIFSIAVSGNNVYSGLIHYGMRRSTNNGDNWISASNSLGTVHSIGVSGDNVFAGAEHYYLYRSTNAGMNWIQTPMISIEVNSIAINGNTIYAGTTTFGVYISTDNGVTWNQSSLNNQNIKSLAVTGHNVFAGTSSNGVYFSNNSGATWIQKNEGLTNLSSDAMLINGDYIYLGTGGAGVWKRALSEVLAIQNISAEIPSAYSLNQNYPNPFNPTTNIKFSLHVKGFTTLDVFDINGKLVNKLLAQELNAGTYTAGFDGSHLASGIYFYALSSGNFSKTMKMVLVK